MSNPASSSCPQCGVTLPASAPAGLCPACLMALNLKTETVFTDDAAAAQPPLPPDQIAPHFPQLEILEFLGRGGMGVVYKARQKSLNRLVALKLLAPERVHDAKFAERFAREARALAALNHPNIVTIYDFGQAGGFFYLLMEFVDGVNLRQLLRVQKFTPGEALAIIPPLCDALQFAHDRGIVHRDIKPENLLLDKSGRIKVADFGVAKILGTPDGLPDIGSAAADNATKTALGTPGYSAPEQKTDPQRVDSRADIYSLGVVFYELLTGELPGKRLEPPSRKVQIDVRLDEVVLRALEKLPELRYQQASDVRTCLETIAATPPGQSSSQSSGHSRPTAEKEEPTSAKAPPNADQFAVNVDLIDQWWTKWKWPLGIVGIFILIFTNAEDKTWNVIIFAYLAFVIAREMLGLRYTKKDGVTFTKDFPFANPPPPSTILPAVEAWLAIMDDGDYAASWEKAAPYFKRVMTRDKWIGLGEKIRHPLGPVHSRKLNSSTFSVGGIHLEVRYDTVFEGLVAATETVTFAKQVDGSWQAIGYLIRPAGYKRLFKRGSFANLPAICLILFVFWIFKSALNPFTNGLSLSSSSLTVIGLLALVWWWWRSENVAEVTVPEAGETANAKNQPSAASGTPGTRRPPALIVVGVLFILSGVLGLCELIHASLTGDNQSYMCIYTLPVGIGLLRLRWRWRLIAHGCVWLYFVMLLILLWALIGKANDLELAPIIFPGSFYGWHLNGLLLTWLEVFVLLGETALIFWIYRVLTRPSIKAIYEAQRGKITDQLEVLLLVLLWVISAYVLPQWARQHRLAAETEIQGLRQIDSPPFLGRIKQGTVELIALRNQDDTNTIWLPNGLHCSKPFPPEQGTGNSWAEDRVMKQMVFQIHDAGGQGTSWPVLRYTPVSIGGSDSSWGESSRHSLDKDLWQTFACPSNTPSMDVSVGIANGPWKVALTLANNSLGGSADYGDWSAAYTAVHGPGGTMAVNCTYSGNTYWESRMVGVGQDGKVTLIPPNSATAGTLSAGGLLVTTTNDYAHIKEFQLQRRKYQWVEFHNVSLRPNHLTTVLVKDAASETDSGPWINWNPHQEIGSFYAVAGTPTETVTVGVDGRIAFRSHDADVWSFETFIGDPDFRAIVHARDQYVVVRESGGIMTSPDGKAWTPQTSSTTNSLLGVAWDGHQYLAGGDRGTILTSPDGIAWTPQPSGSQINFYGFACSGSRYIAVGNDGIRISDDAHAWRSPTKSATVPFTACTWTGHEFLACGLGQDKFPTIYTSPDGDNWTLRDTTITASLRSAITVQGSIYVAGDSVIAKSDDGGTTWTNIFPAAKENKLFMGLATDGQNLIAAGFNHNIWARPLPPAPNTP